MRTKNVNTCSALHGIGIGIVARERERKANHWIYDISQSIYYFDLSISFHLSHSLCALYTSLCANDMYQWLIEHWKRFCIYLFFLCSFSLSSSLHNAWRPISVLTAQWSVDRWGENIEPNCPIGMSAQMTMKAMHTVKCLLYSNKRRTNKRYSVCVNSLCKRWPFGKGTTPDRVMKKKKKKQAIEMGTCRWKASPKTREPWKNYMYNNNSTQHFHF